MNCICRYGIESLYKISYWHFTFMVYIHSMYLCGAGSVRAGTWGRTLLVTDSLEHGSMIEWMRAATARRSLSLSIYRSIMCVCECVCLCLCLCLRLRAAGPLSRSTRIKTTAGSSAARSAASDPGRASWTRARRNGCGSATYLKSVHFPSLTG